MNDKPSLIIIEKNVPIPPKHSGRGSIYRDTAQQMEVGDSVLFDNDRKVEALRAAITHFGFQAVKRKTFDGKWRVWKTEKQEARSE